VQRSNRYLPFLGRALIALPFIFSGIGKLTTYHATVGYISSVGLPLPQLGWLIAVIVELGFATALVLGYRVRPVAIVLALYCLATAIFFHRNLADQEQMINFFKNIMILGGLLQILYFGAGPLSLDARATSHTGEGALRGQLT
jgi:putative oxidoreductase